VFFRAMTLLMPNVPSRPIAAAAVVRAAVDLYGANSAPSNAVSQALRAVGLIN
jgi:Zn-dependent metalloprotease